jgi:type 1 fimbria pilin
MTQAVVRIMGSVRAITDETEYGYDGADTCFMAGLCQVRQSITITRKFLPGERYALIGGGDDDAKDVDISILDESGNEIEKDTETDATPVVLFSPTVEAHYTIRLTLYDSIESRSSFVALAVMAAGGYDVPVDNLVKAAGGLIENCGVIAQEVGKAYFLESPNQVAVWGCLLAKNETLTLTQLNMGSGNRVITAAADTQAKDIDIYLLDGKQQQLKADTEADANPLVIYQSDASASYGVKVSNAESNGPSLVMAAILQYE